MDILDILFWLCYDYDWWLKSNDIDKYMIKLSHGKSTYMTMSILWLWPMLWYPYDTMSMSIWLCLYLCLAMTMSMIEDVNDEWYHMYV